MPLDVLPARRLDVRHVGSAPTFDQIAAAVELASGDQGDELVAVDAAAELAGVEQGDPRRGVARQR
jgi:hypothetical protein